MKRTEYAYVARRVTRTDRIDPGMYPFIVARRGMYTLRYRVDPRRELVLQPGSYGVARQHLTVGGAIYRECMKAVDRLIAEEAASPEKELAETFTREDHR